MKNVPIPSREEDFTADPAELFFDLSFVFAFSRLVFHLVHYPTLRGFGEFVLLFTLIWIAWSNFTWAANAVAGNSRFVRAVFMAATAISLPMAASLEAPFVDGSVVFAGTVSVILTLPILTGAVLLQDEEAIQSSNNRYLMFTIAGIALVLAGGFTDGTLQIGLWIAAVAVLIGNTIDAGGGDWLVRPGHFAERHGLIVIIALGEVVVAIGAPVVETLSEGNGLSGSLFAALTASGILAGLLWWSYFDRPLPALERRHEGLSDGKDSARFARDVYTYNHFFVVGRHFGRGSSLGRDHAPSGRPAADSVSVDAVHRDLRIPVGRRHVRPPRLFRVGRGTPGGRGSAGRSDRVLGDPGRRLVVDRGRCAVTGCADRRALSG